MAPSRQPTSEECDSGAVFETDETGAWHALWLPQFGGYTSRAAVYIWNNSESCFEVAVWHDGEFPTDELRVLHCCDPSQFIEFGEVVKSKMGGAE
jgi:hypothetical protein